MDPRIILISSTTGLFVNLYPQAVNAEELRESVNLDILEHFVYNKDSYKSEIEQYNYQNSYQEFRYTGKRRRLIRAEEERAFQPTQFVSTFHFLFGDYIERLSLTCTTD